VGSTVKDHVWKKFFLVNLTSRGTWNSNADGDMIFNQVWQIIIWTITGGGLDGQVPMLVGPGNAAVDKEEIDRMSFAVAASLSSLLNTNRNGAMDSSML
jgi:hypothetical protein